ncbi:MAG: type II toxin-antitoxin system VapC family toxin [Rhodomicrobium sp.]
MTLVIDASVALKWVLADKPAEQDTDKAAVLLSRIARDNVSLLQPEHWRVEMLSVVARLAPERVTQTLRLIESLNVEIPVLDRIYLRASLLSGRFKHHFFDTLYHAIALENGAMLITADEGYFAKARGQGHIALLTHLNAS